MKPSVLVDFYIPAQSLPFSSLLWCLSQRTDRRRNSIAVCVYSVLHYLEDP